MNNPNDVVQNKHLDALAARIANFLSGDNVDDVVDTEDPDALKISIGDFRFQFTGVIDGLTLYENNFYAGNDSRHSTPLGSVTQSVVDGKTKFVFDLYQGAIDVADGQTGTVSCGKLTPNVDFDFTITPETYVTAGWIEKKKGEYTYTSDDYLGIVSTADKSTTGKISYTFTNSEVMAQDFKITLGTTGLVTPRAGDPDGLGTIDSDKIALTVTLDDTRKITSASVVLKSDSLPASFDQDTTIEFKWTGKEASYGFTPTTSVKIEETYLATLTKSTETPCTFEGTTAESGTTYTFTADAVSQGYKQNGSNVLYRKAAGGDTFTITNLASDLVAVSNADGSYSIYANTDKTNALGTISAPVDGLCTVTILSEKAINGFTDGVVPAASFDITLSDTDAEHNGYIYDFKLGDSLMTANLTDADKATFAVDGTDKTKYTYTPGKTGWKFTAKGRPSYDTGKCTATYTYSPSTAVTDFQAFSITGLKEGLTNLALDLSTGAITATVDGVADTQIATYSTNRKVISIHDNVLPSADHDWIVALDNLHLGLAFADSHTYDANSNVFRASITDSNGEYTCTVTSSVDNHVLWPINYGSLAYRKSRLGKSFTVSGLRSDLGALTYEDTSGWPIFKTVNDVVVANMYDLTFVVNANGLPLNPDNNTVIELTNNTDDFSLSVADDVKRNFADEKITQIGAGIYVYSASGSTVGWFIDGGKIFHNANELNGTTFTLTGLRTDLGALTFDEDGNIHAKNGGIVGKMIRNQITWYQHALLIPSTTVTVQ